MFPSTDPKLLGKFIRHHVHVVYHPVSPYSTDMISAANNTRTSRAENKCFMPSEKQHGIPALKNVKSLKLAIWDIGW